MDNVNSYIKCSIIAVNMYVFVTNAHLCYFTYYIIIIIDSKPNKLQLMRLLTPLAYKWKEIGEALDIRHQALMSLHQIHFSDEQKLSDVLQLWIDGQPTNVNWSTIIRAVESPLVDNLSVAESIRCFLSKSND